MLSPDNSALRYLQNRAEVWIAGKWNGMKDRRMALARMNGGGRAGGPRRAINPGGLPKQDLKPD